MVSYNNAISLFVGYTVFLNFGAVLFMYLEWEDIENVTVDKHFKWTRLEELISNPSPPESEDELTFLVVWLFERCPQLPPDFSLQITTVGNQSNMIPDIVDHCQDLEEIIIERETLYPWSFLDSLYFSMTVCTTIGYGHISPSKPWGRVVCMLYAVFGIPLTMMFLTWTSDFFGEQLFNLFKAKVDTEKQSSKIFIALGTVFYITIGFIIFIFLPAIVFMYTENWTYLEGVYYAFITLTTIGFGDFVTGKSMEGEWEYVYQILVIVWIMGGLGYWVMVANFITRALKSKKMISFAKKATDIKKLMNQVGLTNNDPEFVTQYSKTTLNFMLQLSNALVMPELGQNNGIIGGAAPASQAKPVIPGIASLFGQSGLGGMMATMVPKPNNNTQTQTTVKKETASIVDIKEEVKSENCNSKDINPDQKPSNFLNDSSCSKQQNDSKEQNGSCVESSPLIRDAQKDSEEYHLQGEPGDSDMILALENIGREIAADLGVSVDFTEESKVEVEDGNQLRRELTVSS